MAFQRKPSASTESDAPEPSASTSSSESRLLERVRRGSRGASEALFGRYGAWLRRWTRGRLPERVRGSLDTSDVVQETLGYMFARLEWFESKRAKALRAYLRRVAENRIRDELRRAVRRHGAIAPAQPVRASEDGAPQLQRLVDDQAWRRYLEGLQRLKPRERGWSSAAPSSATTTGSSPSSNACRARMRRAWRCGGP